MPFEIAASKCITWICKPAMKLIWLYIGSNTGLDIYDCWSVYLLKYSCITWFLYKVHACQKGLTGKQCQKAQAAESGTLMSTDHLNNNNNNNNKNNNNNNNNDDKNKKHHYQARPYLLPKLLPMASGTVQSAQRHVQLGRPSRSWRW